MNFLIATAAAQTGAPQTPVYFNFLLIGGLFLFMYFLIIRPQRKRQKEHQTLMGSLAKGDEVVLSSGMLGKIVEVDENYVTLKASDTVELKFQKFAVHAVLPKGTIKSI